MMVIKSYTVTLESEVVDRTKEKLKKEKLSPYINELLKRELGERDDDNETA